MASAVGSPRTRLTPTREWRGWVISMSLASHERLSDENVRPLRVDGVSESHRIVTCHGRYQIGDDHARSWIVVGMPGRGSTPARRASHVDHRQVGFSSTLT